MWAWNSQTLAMQKNSLEFQFRNEFCLEEIFSRIFQSFVFVLYCSFFGFCCAQHTFSSLLVSWVESAQRKVWVNAFLFLLFGFSLSEFNLMMILDELMRCVYNFINRSFTVSFPCMCVRPFDNALRSFSNPIMFKLKIMILERKISWRLRYRNGFENFQRNPLQNDKKKINFQPCGFPSYKCLFSLSMLFKSGNHGNIFSMSMILRSRSGEGFVATVKKLNWNQLKYR